MQILENDWTQLSSTYIPMTKIFMLKKSIIYNFTTSFFDMISSWAALLRARYVIDLTFLAG